MSKGEPVAARAARAVLTERGELWELRGSSIHQRGMFARKPIAAGTKIIEYLGKRVPKAESNEQALAWEEKARKSGEGMVYVFDLNDEFDLDGNIPDNPAKYINHSCSENCEAVNEDDRIFIYSLKDIAQDEELLFDYGYSLEHFLDHPCRCGSKGCVGYIVAKIERPQLKRLLAARAKRKAAAKKAAAAVVATAADSVAGGDTGAEPATKKRQSRSRSKKPQAE